jgi:hypothetical protein
MQLTITGIMHFLCKNIFFIYPIYISSKLLRNIQPFSRLFAYYIYKLAIDILFSTKSTQLSLYSL